MYLRHHTMKQDTIIEVAKALEKIWFEYESKEEFFTYDEEGVRFNYYKCCEKRVICMGSAFVSTFAIAPNEFHKKVLISAFAMAMKNIESKIELENNLSIVDKCAFEASMMSFDKMKEDLEKEL